MKSGSAGRHASAYAGTTHFQRNSDNSVEERNGKVWNGAELHVKRDFEKRYGPSD
jgi:hypothetical protein